MGWGSRWGNRKISRANWRKTSHFQVAWIPTLGATWLLTELDPNDPDLAFGLCDLGLGEPELGYVCLTELETLRGPMGLPVERDLHFEADKPISAYAAEAHEHRRIRA